MKHIPACMILVIFMTGAAFAQEQATIAKYALQYSPSAECVVQQQLHARVEQILLEGNPLGIDGWVNSKLQRTGTPFDPETKTFKMKLQFSEIEQEFNGQAIEGDSTAVLELAVKPKGQIDAKQALGDEMKLTGSTGVPIQLLGLLCQVVRFPEGEVAIGQTWTVEDVINMGKDEAPIPIEVTSKLTKVENGRYAWVQSSMVVHVPNFEAPNPMGYGDDVPVTKAVLKIKDLVRVFDMQESVVTKAEGKASFTGQLDLGGFLMNAQIDTALKMEPQPKKPAEEVQQTTTTGENAGGASTTPQAKEEQPITQPGTAAG